MDISEGDEAAGRGDRAPTLGQYWLRHNAILHVVILVLVLYWVAEYCYCYCYAVCATATATLLGAIWEYCYNPIRPVGIS